MNNKLLISVLAIFLVFSSFALAEKVILKQDTITDLKVPCIFNGSYCNNQTNCTITIISPNGTTIIDNQLATYNSAYYNYTLNETQTSSLGEHKLNMACTSPSYSGFNQMIFEVTPTGTIPSDSQSGTYLIFIGILILLGLITQYFSWTIKGTNTYTVDEHMEINYGKYFKILLFGLSYLFFLLATYLSWQVADRFLYIDIVTQILRFFFLFLEIIMYPILIICVILIFIILIKDIREKNLSKRNFTRN